MNSVAPPPLGIPQPADLASSTPVASAPATPGLWRRMACWMYEGVLLFPVVFMPTWLFSTLGQMRNGIDPIRHPLLQAILFVVLGVYCSWLWSRGQTLAMKTWNIRVVDTQGMPLTPRRALLRYLLCWIWFWPLTLKPLFDVSAVECVVLTCGWVVVWAVLARFQPQRQFWHDVWAGTRLVTSKPMSR